MQRNLGIVGSVVGLTFALSLLAQAFPTFAAADDAPEPDRRSIVTKLGDTVSPVQIENAPARTAFIWWSRATGIPLVIDPAALEREGIDLATPINLQLHAAPAGKVLSLIMSQASQPDAPLLYQVTPWYIRIETKAQADNRLVLRIYPVDDLIFPVPNFAGAASMDLGSALGNTNSGGGGAGGAASNTLPIFSDDAGSKDAPGLSRSDNGEQLAQLIRDTITPEIWQESGGPATCRYWNGRLIVRAPEYVHAQIGMNPVPSHEDAAGPRRAGAVRRVEGSNSRNPVAGVQRTESKSVSGVNQSTR